jgi:hypothetical protein
MRQLWRRFVEWLAVVTAATCIAGCGPGAREDEFVSGDNGPAELSAALASLEKAGPGLQNVWVLHPQSDAAGLSACLTHTSRGQRLLVWSKNGHPLREPVSPRLHGLRDPAPVIDPASPLQEGQGAPGLAFRLPEKSRNSFLTGVFRECAGIEAKSADFRFQWD